MKPRFAPMRFSALFRLVGWIGGPTWLSLTRWRLGGSSIDITPHLPALEPYFPADLLADVRVRVVDRLKVPGCRIRPMAICFGRVILLSRDVAEGPTARRVIFHELVHTVQMRRMGRAGFCAAYLAGWWSSGRSYFAIPLEEEAYTLQDRFESGEKFLVVQALRDAEFLVRRQP